MNTGRVSSCGTEFFAFTGLRRLMPTYANMPQDTIPITHLDVDRRGVGVDLVVGESAEVHIPLMVSGGIRAKVALETKRRPWKERIGPSVSFGFRGTSAMPLRLRAKSAPFWN